MGFRVSGRDSMVPPGVHDRVPKIRWLIRIFFLKIYVFLIYKIAINKGYPWLSHVQTQTHPHVDSILLRFDSSLCVSKKSRRACSLRCSESSVGLEKLRLASFYGNKLFPGTGL